MLTALIKLTLKLILLILLIKIVILIYNIDILSIISFFNFDVISNISHNSEIILFSILRIIVGILFILTLCAILFQIWIQKRSKKSINNTMTFKDERKLFDIEYDEIELKQSKFRWKDYHPKWNIIGKICPACSSKLKIRKSKEVLFNKYIYKCPNCTYAFADNDISC